MLSLKGSDMGLREVIKKASERPEKIAGLASLPFLGLAGYEFYKLFTHQEKISTLGQAAVFTASVLYWAAVFVGGMAGLKMLGRFACEPEMLQRIKQCKARAGQLQSPEFPETESVHIPLTFKDYLFASTVSGPESIHRHKNAKYGRKNRNPLFLLTAATGYITEKECDDALICIRDALDMLGNKRPSRLLALDEMVGHLVQKIKHFINPDDIFAYIQTAVKSAPVDLRRSWYYITLAKEIAKELDQNKLETYVIDALLATAQQRSDRKKAWRDAFIEMHERFKPRRLGESRNPVWTLESEDSFFSGTFAFKGNPSLKDLENEWRSRFKLEQTLDADAMAPQALDITDEPYKELYVYIMRYLPGELLLDQLLRGDKRGLEKVIPVLARIHARYPTEGLPRTNLEEKTAKKLKSLGMQSAFKYFRPVIEDLQAQPIWAANKDAHPEQWQMLNNPCTDAKVGVLDAEIKEVQPVVLDTANLLYYAGDFTREEREKYAHSHLGSLRKEGTSNPAFSHAYEGTNLLRAVDNAAIFRMLCLIEAWSDPGRPNMQIQRERLVRTACRVIDDLKEHDARYYSKNEKEYNTLKERFPEFLNVA